MKSIKNITKISAMALSACLLAPQAFAEVLLIERVESKSGMSLPSKSSTMDQVRAQYGEPLSQSGPVGDPPITQWEYPEYIVYFEHSHVITAVVKKSKATEIGPKSIESSTDSDSSDTESGS